MVDKYLGLSQRVPDVRLVELDDQEAFDAFLSASSAGAIIYFYAPWCKFCKALDSLVLALTREWSANANFAKLNVDKAGTVSESIGIRMVPALLFFVNSVVVSYSMGTKSKRMIEADLGLIKKSK